MLCRAMCGYLIFMDLYSMVLPKQERAVGSGLIASVESIPQDMESTALADDCKMSLFDTKLWKLSRRMSTKWSVELVACAVLSA